MTLATVGADGRPSTRIVLLKGCDERGLVWYTNYQSRKGARAGRQPLAALQFHWVELERVVRIEGRVEQVEDDESDAYFASRPLDSRIGAWASPQSQVIGSRAVLVANAAKYARAIPVESAPPAALGRLSPAARHLGVLARPQVAPARPAAVPARSDAVDSRAPRALTASRAARRRSRRCPPGTCRSRSASSSSPRSRHRAPARRPAPSRWPTTRRIASSRAADPHAAASAPRGRACRAVACRAAPGSAGGAVPR